MKNLFPTMSCSSLTDPALLRTHPQGWCISHMVYSYTGSWKHSGHYHSDRLHSATSGFECCIINNKSWLKCIIVTIANWLKIVNIVTECFSDYKDTNK